jgi:hypothetical protein
VIEFREIGKALAWLVPTRLTDAVANYAVLHENPDLLPSDYIVRNRNEYFARVNDAVGGSQVKLRFLEFGVLDGDSIRLWASLNGNLASRFVGFDSFEGIPGAWRGRKPGYFDRGGAIPQIADERVRFVRGWFNRTLPSEIGAILDSDGDAVTLAHIDSDLYASALYCLTVLGGRLPSFYVMFDEYGAGEARALRDFLEAYGAQFTALLGLKRTTRSALPTRVFGRIEMAPPTA